MGRDDEGAEAGSVRKPSAPGWYPDPWSADGKGERYFDGKRWGTSERPLARHSKTGVVDARARRSRPRGRRSWRKPSGTAVAVVLIVAAAAGLTLLQRRHNQHDSALPPDSGFVGPDRPPPGAEEASQPLGRPPSVPASGGKYEIIAHQPDDPSAPVAFDPCRPVHYVVNPTGGPADGTEILHRAIAKVAAATGLTFTDDGTTREAPTKDRANYLPDLYGPQRWAPVLIAWSNESDFPSLAGYVAGIGSPGQTFTTDGHLVYVSGEVVLDGEQLSANHVPDRGEVEAIVLHELGHLVGLDHTSDRNEVMFSESQFNVRDYGIGDRRGLALLGTQPCHPDV